ncbi:hypothetical protein STEG23_019128 [Scotinomys teguina]
MWILGIRTLVLALTWQHLDDFAVCPAAAYYDLIGEQSQLSYARANRVNSLLLVVRGKAISHKAKVCFFDWSFYPTTGTLNINIDMAFSCSGGPDVTMASVSPVTSPQKLLTSPFLDVCKNLYHTLGFVSRPSYC